MALTLAQRDTLTTTDAFLGRIRQALRHYACYTRDNSGATNDQKAWAALALSQHRVPQMASDMAGEVVEDPNIVAAAQADASDVPDANVSAAVEAICLKYTGA